jgi:hypothetical protein
MNQPSQKRHSFFAVALKATFRNREAFRKAKKAVAVRRFGLRGRGAENIKYGLLLKEFGEPNHPALRAPLLCFALLARRGNSQSPLLEERGKG